MQTRTLGRTGLEVSVVGFGALTIGGGFGPVDDQVSMAALHTAVDAGINFLDTADAYGAGHSEELIGKFLQERPDRDRIIICSKGGNNLITRQRNFTPAYIRNCVEGSLKRLNLEAIDVYLLHNPAMHNLKDADSFDLLDDFKAQGKIKHWGVSVNTLAECDYTVDCGRPAVMQMEYNLLEQEPAAVFARAYQTGVGVIARVPLKRGLLAGRFDEHTTFDDTDLRQRILTTDTLPTLISRVRRMEAIVASSGLSMAEVAMRFCVSNPHVAVTIPGVRTPEQARSNASACEPLPADLLQALHQLA